jgi:hypothetical protein
MYHKIQGDILFLTHQLSTHLRIENIFMTQIRNKKSMQNLPQ